MGLQCIQDVRVVPCSHFEVAGAAWAMVAMCLGVLCEFSSQMVGTAENLSVLYSSRRDTVTWRDTYQLGMSITGKCR
jgi:hypothetical protein